MNEGVKKLEEDDKTKGTSLRSTVPKNPGQRVMKS